MYECFALMYVYALCARLVSGVAREGYQVPWNQSYKLSWAVMLMLGVKPEPSAGAAVDWTAEPSLRPLVFIF